MSNLQENFNPEILKLKNEFSNEKIERLVLKIAEEQVPSSMEVGVLKVVREVVQDILYKNIDMDKSNLVEIIRERLKDAGIKIIDQNVIPLKDFGNLPADGSQTNNPSRTKAL